MDSPTIGIVDQFGEAPHWATPASPMFQAPQVASPHYNTVKNLDWGTAPQAGYRESRHHNARSKPQWAAGRRHQQNKFSPENSRTATSHAQWQAQAPAQPPTGVTNPGGFQESQGPVAVKLQGLPRTLCQQNFLEAMLDQAGLTDNILSCQLGQDQDTGKALIYLTNRSAAQMCMEHFSGCCWDKTGTSVTAQMVESQPGNQPGKGRQAVGSPNNIVDKTPGGKTRKAPRTKIRNEPFMAMPQPPLQYPATMVSTPWGDFTQNIMVQNEFPAEEREMTSEDSTLTGSSSGRASWDTACDSFLACDTDDGF